MSPHSDAERPNATQPDAERPKEGPLTGWFRSPESDAGQSEPAGWRPQPATTTREYRMKYGIAAFNRYREIRTGITFAGHTMPMWEGMADDLQDAWIAAGMAAAELGEP